VELMAVWAFLVLVVSTLVTARVEPFDETLGRGYDYVVTDGVYGIIVDEAFAPRFINERAREEVEGYWTPTRDDVTRAEDLVRRERGSDRRDDRERAREAYADRLAVGGRVAVDSAVSRQYFGVIEDGTRLLHINAALSGLPEDPLTLLVVADGGPGYWYATIDADSWTIDSYVENGYA
jgi:hypothetical protein